MIGNVIPSQTIANLISALIGGLVVLIATLITVRSANERDREAVWRKMKLDIYREFILSASGMVEDRADRAAELKYLDASHSLMLVASPEVLKILFLFQKNKLNSDYLKPLFIALRNDIKPRPDVLDLHLEFQFFKFDQKN
jgi:hypothetical protein